MGARPRRPGDLPRACLRRDRGRSGYAGRLPDEEIVAVLRRARGKLGTGLDYLLRTADGLAEAGVRDPYVSRLAALALTK